MKRLLIFFLIWIFFIYITASGAQGVSKTPTPSDSPTPTPTAKNKAKEDTGSANLEVINELKEKIASKVAQLKLVKRRGTIGSVSDLSNSQITLTDLSNNNRLIDVDELTKFSSPSANSSFGISDIKKGTTLGILGLYNKQSQRILARFIEVLSLPQFVQGAVNTIDKDNFTIEIMSDNAKSYTVEIENTTKTKTYSKDGELVRSGFSKIKEEMRIYVVGYLSLTDKNKINAQRIILFPALPVDPKIVLPPKNNTPSPTSPPTPTTSAAKKPAPTGSR